MLPPAVGATEHQRNLASAKGARKLVANEVSSAPGHATLIVLPGRRA